MDNMKYIHCHKIKPISVKGGQPKTGNINSPVLYLSDFLLLVLGVLINYNIL